MKKKLIILWTMVFAFIGIGVVPAQAATTTLVHAYSDANFGGTRTDLTGNAGDCDKYGYSITLNSLGKSVSSFGHRSFSKCNYAVVWKRNAFGGKGQLCYTGLLPVKNMATDTGPVCNDDAYSIDVSYVSSAPWAY